MHSCSRKLSVVITKFVQTCKSSGSNGATCKYEICHFLDSSSVLSPVSSINITVCTIINTSMVITSKGVVLMVILDM